MQFGSVHGVLLAVEAFGVHGQPNWRCIYRLDSDARDMRRLAVLPREAVHPEPHAGQRIVLEHVMGEPVSMRLAAEDD